MQLGLINRSCDSRMFLCEHAGKEVDGLMWKIEGRHAKVVQRKALCIFGGQGIFK